MEIGEERPLRQSIDRTFIDNFTLLRTENGMSQLEVAEKMQEKGHPWRQSTVHRFETNQRIVRLDEALDLADIFNKSLEYMLQPSQSNSLLRQLEVDALDCIDSEKDLICAINSMIEIFDYVRNTWGNVGCGVAEYENDPAAYEEAMRKLPEESRAILNWCLSSETKTYLNSVVESCIKDYKYYR